ncbi:hypothetical protein PSCLAVI8L_60028 [Pseudoclavibacter sp. 8L]|nr:hypothetical protein PSCLAVI8L_60028 [Pseudoclavibacter sp. 8L]
MCIWLTFAEAQGGESAGGRATPEASPAGARALARSTDGRRSEPEASTAKDSRCFWLTFQRRRACKVSGWPSDTRGLARRRASSRSLD